MEKKGKEKVMAIDDNKTRPPKSSGVHRVDCGQIRELLFAYLTHELGDAQSLLVREHLRHCPDCATEAREMQETVDLIKQNDPAASVATSFAPKRRKRLIWLMEHPFIAKCIKHNRITSLVVMIVVLAILFAILWSLRIYREEVTALPPVRFEPSVDVEEPIDLELPLPYVEPSQRPIPGIDIIYGNINTND